MSWKKAGGFDVPLFVPDSHLVKLLRDVEDRSSFGRKVRFKIVETAGNSIKSLVQNSDAFDVLATLIIKFDTMHLTSEEAQVTPFKLAEFENTVLL